MLLTLANASANATAMTQTLLFRADADGQTGSGHVMRSLAIAEAAASMGMACRFAMQACPDGLRSRLRRAGFETDALPAGGAPDAFLDLIRGTAPVAVIIDGYHFNESYRSAVRSAGRPVLAMDDLMGSHVLHADLVVNANPAASPGDYTGRAGKARLLLGLEYAALRKEFRQAAQRPFPALADRQRLLITIGASDPLRLSLALAETLMDILPDRVTIDLVLGAAHPHSEACERLRERNPSRLTLHINADNMAELMRGAGLAVSAAGSTVLELAAMAVPGILLVTAENQAPALVVHSALGWCRGLDARSGDRRQEIAALAKALWNDVAARRAMAAKAADLVDGKGAGRILAALLEFTDQAP